jgi:hypothetical protein
MADQNPQHGRRQHFHRGRRGGPDRRNERRGPGPAQSPEQAPREHREHVDVEQIMREIRSRVSQRHGIELTTQQIQELAARRLEAILDPRTVKPSLLEQIRRSTSTPLDTPSSPEPTYSFEDTTIYETPRGSLRFIRRLLNPLLKLFFNPNPLIAALSAQTRLNQAAAHREAERERRQAEWNALHYEILQRLVLEVSRTSLEAQQLSMRIDALSAKVDFAERRARSIEGTLHQARPTPRHESAPSPAQFAQAPREPGATEVAAAPAPQEGVPGEGGRRRRRRRRGRRSQGFTPEGAALGVAAGPAAGESRLPEGGEGPDIDDRDDDDGGPDIGDETEPFDGMASPVELASPVDSLPDESESVEQPIDVMPPQDTASVDPPPVSYEPPPGPVPPIETRVEPAPTEATDPPQPPSPDRFGD